MILGIISDIHGNWWTLRDILRQNSTVQQWICLGDFTGLLPTVNETIDLLIKHHVMCVRGDHETCLVNNTELKQSFSGNEVLILQRKIIPKKTIKWIQSLPMKQDMCLNKVKILLTHNITGPSPNKKFVFDLNRLEQSYNTFDIALFGHTHLPFYWEGKQTIFINPGSLGFPISKTKLGVYATVKTETLQTKFHWVNVHTEDCIEALQKYAYPKRIIDILKGSAL